MKIKNNNPRVSYSKLVDSINNYIDIQTIKNVNASKIIDGVHNKIIEQINISNDWKQKHINFQTVELLEKLVPKNVTPFQILTLIKRFLEYRSDTSYFRAIQNVYTLIEYYKNPDYTKNASVNWKKIMNTKN